MKAKKVIAMLLAATLSVTAFTGWAINKNRCRLFNGMY